MRDLIFTDNALDDFTSIEAYVESKRDRATAIALSDSLKQRCARLAALPGTLGSDRSDLRPGIRSTPHGNYFILFRYTDEAVEIVNVVHASRDVSAQFESD